MIWSRRWKPTVEPNGFDNYLMHALRPQNPESGEPEIKKIGEKSNDKNASIVHNDIRNVIWNKITDML